MKNLSQWASRHGLIAILLLVLGEVVNGFNGVLLGASGLGTVSPFSLCLGILLLTGLILFVLSYARQSYLRGNYWAGRRWLFMAFLGNFLLFTLLGGLWNQRIQEPRSTVSALGNRRIDVVRDTVIPVDSTRQANWSAAQANVPTADQPAPAGKRAGYILLGLLGIVVAYFVAGIACSIACAGYGFLAAVTFLFGLGGLAGTVYFFGRAMQKPLKRRRDMTPDERRRDSRRFWLAWLIIVGIVSLLLVIG